MEELERTKVGRFLKEDAVTLDEVRQKMEQGEGAELFTPLDQIFGELPAVTVTDAKAWMSYNGNDLPERFLLEKESQQMGRKSEYIIPERILSAFISIVQGAACPGFV